MNHAMLKVDLQEVLARHTEERYFMILWTEESKREDCSYVSTCSQLDDDAEAFANALASISTMLQDICEKLPAEVIAHIIHCRRAERAMAESSNSVVSDAPWCNGDI